MVKTKLTNNQIKEMVELDTAIKTATARFKQLKDAYCAELEDGKYISEGIGMITKITTNRATIDYKQLIADNPQIDLQKYTTRMDVSAITVKNLHESKNVLQKFLKL